MRIEDVISRYLPSGGTVSDQRPERQRGRMSFAADAGVEVTAGSPGDDGAQMVVVDGGDLAAVRPDGGGVTVVTLAAGDDGDGPLPDVLAWAGDRGGQVVEITRLLAPNVTAVVVRHGGVAEVPAVPGRPEPIPADDATWRRLAGELLYERHRAAVRDGELDRLRAEVAKLRRAVKRARDDSAAAPPARRRLRLPALRRSSSGNGP